MNEEKLYIIIDKETKEILDYSFEEITTEDFDILEINVKKLGEYYSKHGVITIWQNLEDERELIITAPHDWDECVWFEYDKTAKEVVKELEEEGY